MIHITEKKLCCACGACVQICPKSCIEFEEDTEGFFYPVIDEQKCIDCGLCEKSCPILTKTKRDAQKNERLAETRKAFVAYNCDASVRLDSSSGGVFSALASYIISKGATVYGAAFDENFCVHHIAVRNNGELEKLRGSKYIQSRTEQTFKEVKKKLDNNEMVLYSGTPCQIAGIKTFLKKNYSNFYTVAILCHGVPSLKLWRTYLNEIEQKYKSKVNGISFRDKVSGWKNYSVTMTFDNHNRYKRDHRDNEYMTLFLSNVCLRPSCHDCKFKDYNDPADITIGDCWGAENHLSDMEDGKGTSIVIVHTQKGNNLLEQIMGSLSICEADLDTIWPCNSDSRISVKPHPKRKAFFHMLQNNKDIKTLCSVLKPPISIRIVRKIKYYFGKREKNNINDEK